MNDVKELDELEKLPNAPPTPIMIGKWLVVQGEMHKIESIDYAHKYHFCIRTNNKSIPRLTLPWHNEKLWRFATEKEIERTMKTKDLKHPMQPIGFDDAGIIRFKENKIVSFLLDSGTFDLNQIRRMLAEGVFTNEDYTHLMQLIGYSVSGYGELNTSPTDLVTQADEIANELYESIK